MCTYPVVLKLILNNFNYTLEQQYAINNRILYLFIWKLFKTRRKTTNEDALKNNMILITYVKQNTYNQSKPPFVVRVPIISNAYNDNSIKTFYTSDILRNNASHLV